MRQAPPLLVLFAGLALGCASTTDDGSDGADQADTARHDSEIVATSEGGLQLLTPYNYVFDIAGSGSPCVAYAGGAAVQVTNLTTDVAINYVSSLSTLEDQLGIDAAIGLKADMIGGGQITSKYTQSFSKGRSQYSYLLKVAQHYDVVVSAPIKMTAQPGNPDEFLRACGDSYVKGLRYGASLYVLMTVDAPTQTQADQIAVGVTASADKKLGGVGATGNLAGNVTSSKTVTDSQLSVTFAAQAVGFDPRAGSGPSLNIPTSASGTIVPDTMNALSGYLDKLAASVAADRAKDASSNGVDPARNAVPTSVVRGYYTLAAGFDTRHNPFDTLNDRLRKAADFVSKLGYLRGQLDDVYYDEIQGFLGADDTAKAKFNVAPPGAPLANATEVSKVAQQQEAIFRPGGGSGQLAGNVTSGVRKLGYNCVDSARAVTNGVSAYAPCQPDVTKQPEYIAALDALDRYAAKSRVLPTHYFGGGDAISDSCKSASAAAGATLLLVDKTQVTQLAPSVAADPKQCAWYREPSCGALSTGYMSTTDGFQCGLDANPFRSCAVFCVAPDGVFGVPRLLGRGAPPR